MATENEDLVLSISADTRQIMNAMKRLTGEIAKNTSGIQKQFDDLGRGVDKSMATAMQKRIDSMVGVGKNATKEWTGALADQGKEMERLRAKFNPLFAAVTSYKSSSSEIRAAHRLGAISSDEMTAALGRERQAALASIAAIKQRSAAISDTPVMRGTTGAGSFNTSSLAAQGFDIMATAGSMPFYTVALQQGPQVAQVFNDIRASGQSIGPAVAGAFAQILNPVSLVTIGVIGATAAAVQYGASLWETTEESKKALQEQADLIQRVAEKWGDALPAVRALANEQDRLAGRKDVRESTDITIAETFSKIRSEVVSAGDEIEAMLGLLNANVPPEQLVAVQQALRTLDETAAGNKTTVTELDAAHAALVTAMASSGIPVFEGTASALAAMRPELVAVTEDIAKANEAAASAQAFNDLQAQINSLSSAKAREEINELTKQMEAGEISVADFLAELARISGYAPDVSGIISAARAVAEEWGRARQAASTFTGKPSQGGRVRYNSGAGGVFLPDSAETPSARPNDIQRLDWEAEGRERAARSARKSSGKSKEETEAERKKKAIDDVVASLKFEQEQLGRTGTEQRIYNELKRAGVDINSETGRQIATMVTTLESERQAMEASKKAIEARGQAIENAFSMGADAIESILDNSVSAEDAIRKLTVQLALAAAQAALLGSGPLAGLFGSGGGLLGQSAPFTSTPNGFASMLGLPGHASGTANTGGARGQVQGLVHGQEAVIPLPNGGKVPVQLRVPQMPAIQSANSGGVSAPVHVTIDARGADREGLARVEAQVARLKAELPSQVVATVRDAQKRRVLG